MTRAQAVSMLVEAKGIVGELERLSICRRHNPDYYECRVCGMTSDKPREHEHSCPVERLTKLFGELEVG